jgi:hypothetical protein
MTTSRRLTASLIVSALMTLAIAATAAAGTPPSGQGLTGLASEGITSLTCPGTSITADDVVVPRGGGAATWTTVDGDGRMYVLQSINASGTLTPPVGDPIPISFSKTWGNKTGRSETLTCTFVQHGSEDGFTFDATGTATLVRIR